MCICACVRDCARCVADAEIGQREHQEPHSAGRFYFDDDDGRARTRLSTWRK